jgi:hypothetical protein
MAAHYPMGNFCFETQILLTSMTQQIYKFVYKAGYLSCASNCCYVRKKYRSDKLTLIQGSDHVVLFLILLADLLCRFPLTTTLCYSLLLYATLRYSTLLYATLRYSTLLYATLRYSTLLYATQRYSMLLYATLH